MRPTISIIVKLPQMQKLVDRTGVGLEVSDQLLVVSPLWTWPSSRSCASHRCSSPRFTVDNIESRAVRLSPAPQREDPRCYRHHYFQGGVLILDCLTDERKAVLDALREELRKRNYLPILFDFNVPATRDITETVSLLARMAASSSRT